MDSEFAALVGLARLAPSVHNVQPARWRRDGDVIVIAADLAAALPASDPSGRDAGLSCGAAAEATVLAMGGAARVDDLWLADDRATWPGHRIAARIAGRAGGPAPGAALLARRFTHRGAFLPAGAEGWAPADAVIVADPAGRDWLARAQDRATARVLCDDGQRAELRRWLRLSPHHPRIGLDGMSAAALRMGPATALAAGLALGPLWPGLRALGLARALGGEAGKTRSAACIALFHRPHDESPVTSGRHYLRLWLEATGRGWAGWPMAALGDDRAESAAAAARFGIPRGRRLVQALRFGPPDAPPPPRARLPPERLVVG